MTLTPKGWQSFQHYRDRSPPWIKLHRTLLDDFEFHCLPVASKALAPMLWLLAAEYEGGAITASHEEIAFRLRIASGDLQEALRPLIDKGFFIARELLAERKQTAMPEREEEEEREEEIEEETETEGGALENARESKSKRGSGRIEREKAIVFADAHLAEPKPKGKSLISDDALATAARILEAMRKDPGDPFGIGAPLTVQGWFNAGWNSECILIGVKRAMQSRGGEAPESLKYFEKAIARAHADLTAPVPIVVDPPGERIRAQTGQRSRPETLCDVARRHAESGISFGPRPTGIPADLGGLFDSGVQSRAADFTVPPERKSTLVGWQRGQ